MSRAFTKEDDGESEELPPRPVSPLPNYVTREGLAFLEAKVRELGDRHSELVKSRGDREKARKLKEVERDLRYYERRAESAILIDHSEKSPPEALFGAEVTVAEGSETRTWRIVGEDEADAAAGKLCWASPLADALLGKKAGETARWVSDGKTVELRVASVRYPRG